MKNVSDAVRELLSTLPFIAEAMSEGLINQSALARKIRPEIERLTGKRVSEAALLMAINRLPSVRSPRIRQKLQRFCRNLGEITVRTRLTEISYPNGERYFKRSAELAEKAGAIRSTFFTLTRAIHETTMICSEELLSKQNASLRSEVRQTGLAAVSLRLPEENTQIPGFYQFLLQPIASKGINLEEVISTRQELCLVVKEKDVNDLVQVLIRLKTGI